MYPQNAFVRPQSYQAAPSWGQPNNGNSFLKALIPVVAYYVLAPIATVSTATTADLITARNADRTALLAGFGSLALLAGL